MVDYQDLSNSESGVTVVSGEIGHIISSIAMEFGFLCTTILQMYVNIRYSVKNQTFNIYVAVKDLE